MTGSPPARPGRTARLMLLLATMFGLAAMHTLGHHGPHLMPGHHSAHPAAMAQDVPAAAAGVVLRAAACEGCTAALIAPMRGGDGPSGWEICVAVLVGFAVLLLGAVLLSARRAAAIPRQAGRSCPARPRGPPARRVGLSLASVSVLRL